MIKWEELSWQQKAAFWFFIGIAGWFSPEIALLFHFGGIEVVFAFLALYLLPAIRLVLGYYQKCENAVALAAIAYRNSASARPGVYFIQAVFCSVAFIATGSIAFSAVFFMPGMIFNGALT
tara:strand:- start:107 stop:469 length:363 start_codon:yes stop_codon:yes gene_type:complete